MMELIVLIVAIVTGIYVFKFTKNAQSIISTPIRESPNLSGVWVRTK